eukprot:6210341-Pleurochrysis_carterae.AAC.1
MGGRFSWPNSMDCFDHRRRFNSASKQPRETRRTSPGLCLVWIALRRKRFDAQQNQCDGKQRSKSSGGIAWAHVCDGML